MRVNSKFRHTCEVLIPGTPEPKTPLGQLCTIWSNPGNLACATLGMYTNIQNTGAPPRQPGTLREKTG